MRLLHSEYHNQTSAYRTYAHYTYDGINLRKHRYEDATYGDSAEERLEVLELYSEGKAYVTNVQTRVCQIYNLECVLPRGVHFLETTFGS